MLVATYHRRLGGNWDLSGRKGGQQDDIEETHIGRYCWFVNIYTRRGSQTSTAAAWGQANYMCVKLVAMTSAAACIRQSNSNFCATLD
jgi:hypothetical protein